MTVALARRLVWEGVITPEDASTALSIHVRERIPFLRALIRSSPGLLSRLEGELGHGRAATSLPILPDADLLRALPEGLSAMFLAVPVSKDPETGVVRVMAADPTDTQIAVEMSHHLGATVEVVSAPLRVMLEAVRTRSEPAPERGSFRTPAFGVKAAAPPSSRPPQAWVNTAGPAPSPEASTLRQSEPPIPLVRVSHDVPLGPTTVKGVAPQASGASFASSVVVPARGGPRATSEPIIQLTRTKSLAPAPPSSPISSAPNTLQGPPSPAPTPGPPGTQEAVLAQLGEAQSAEDVVAILVHGVAQVARRAVILAVRGKVFEGREASDPAAHDAVRALVVSGDRPSVLLTAAQTGEYVGPMPETLVHQELHRVLGEPSGDIAVGSVTVSGRAALLYVAAGLDTAYLATRRGAALARAAGQALERIVRERKK